MNKLLIVIDYQKDFVDGALGFKDAASIEGNIIKLIKEFRNNGDLVCFTKDLHSKDYLNTIEGKNLPIKHCIKGSDGANLTDNIKELVCDSLVFEKDGFTSLELANYIKENNDKIDEIYLCGLMTDYCVLTNAIVAKAAANPYCKIKVIKDAISTNNEVEKIRAFDTYRHLHIELV